MPHLEPGAPSVGRCSKLVQAASRGAGRCRGPSRAPPCQKGPRAFAGVVRRLVVVAYGAEPRLSEWRAHLVLGGGFVSCSAAAAHSESQRRPRRVERRHAFCTEELVGGAEAVVSLDPWPGCGTRPKRHSNQVDMCSGPRNLAPYGEWCRQLRPPRKRARPGAPFGLRANFIEDPAAHSNTYTLRPRPPPAPREHNIGRAARSGSRAQATAAAEAEGTKRLAIKRPCHWGDDGVEAPPGGAWWRYISYRLRSFSSVVAISWAISS